MRQHNQSGEHDTIREPGCAWPEMPPTAQPTGLCHAPTPAAVEERLQAHYDLQFGDDDVALDDTPPGGRARPCRCACCARSPTPFARNAIRARPARTRIIASFGVGADHIDLAAARAAGIVVTNTPDVLTEDTADLALTLLLMTARRAGEGERELRSGAWHGWRPTHLLGVTRARPNAGDRWHGAHWPRARAAARTVALECACSTTTAGGWIRNVERTVGARWCATLDGLLAESDFVSLHCPATAETHHLIERAAPQPDEERRVPHQHGTRRAGGRTGARGRARRGSGWQAPDLDVYEGEPAVSVALRAREDVVLLPHLGSATTETRTAMGMRAVDNLDAFFNGEEPPDRVA